MSHLQVDREVITSQLRIMFDKDHGKSILDKEKYWCVSSNTPQCLAIVTSREDFDASCLRDSEHDDKRINDIMNKIGDYSFKLGETSVISISDLHGGILKAILPDDYAKDFTIRIKSVNCLADGQSASIVFQYSGKLTMSNTFTSANARQAICDSAKAGSMVFCAAAHCCIGNAADAADRRRYGW